jgi:TolB-like protein/Flp pilus assembly protein TadD
VALLAAAGLATQSFWSRRPAPVVSASGLRSLVVLPLRNLSGDPAQDYFVDGMTELLTADLSSVSSLRVISDTSAMTYRGSQKPIPAIGKELHVDGVVTGSITRSGDRVRVTLQVIHAGTNLSLWGDSYEREASDAFRLQADIARMLVSKLRAALTTGERQRLEQTYVANPQAQELYLRGRYLLHTLNRDRLREARTLFERAVQVDPNYALAWANLAQCYTLLEALSVITPAEARRLATAAATEALAHDSSTYEAHTTLADVKFKYDWDWAEADVHYRQAIDANPSFSVARGLYARFLAAAGRVDEAVAQAKRGEELDPVSADMKRTVAMMLFYQRHYQEAVDKAAESQTLDVNLPGGYVVRGRALAGLGRFDDAIRDLRQAATLSQDPGELTELGRVLAIAGHQAEAESILARLRKPAALGNGFLAPQDVAYIQAALGRRDEALEGLEEAVNQRSSRILWLRVDPRVDALRSEPRFQALIQRIGGLSTTR